MLSFQHLSDLVGGGAVVWRAFLEAAVLDVAARLPQHHRDVSGRRSAVPPASAAPCSASEASSWVSWELNSARGALSPRLGGRHPGPHSLLQTTQPQGISLCLLRLGGSGGLPSPARATTVESRRYGTPHAAAHNRLQDSEVARLQCEMDRMKQQHTANILDSMPPWGAQERRCADAAV